MRETKLRMDRGDSASFTVAATQANGDPQSIVGATVWFTAKDRLTDEDAGAVIAKTTTGDAGVTIVDGPGGIARVDLDPADTAALTGPTTLYWDVQAKDASGSVRTLARGRLFISLDVTRATA